MPGERRSVRYRFRWPGGSEGTSGAASVSESWPSLASRGANAWAGGDIPALGPQSGVAGRKPLRPVALTAFLCYLLRAKKEDRDRSGVLTRIDLKSLIPRSRFLDPSAWRASGRGALCAPPILRSGLGALALRLRRWNLAAPPAPSGLPGLPFVRPLLSGVPLRLAPSRSALRLGWPKGPHRRSAMAGSSACASEPITLRPAVAGAPLPVSPPTWRPWGYFVARLVGSYDEAPEASADEALQFPLGLPLLPGNFRPLGSLKPPPWFRRLKARASWCRSRGSFRLREPLAGWSFMASVSPQLAPRFPRLQVAPATEPGSRVVTLRPSLWKCAHHANVTFALPKLRSEGRVSWTGGLGCDSWSQSLSGKQRIGRLEAVSSEVQRTPLVRGWPECLN